MCQRLINKSVLISRLPLYLKLERQYAETDIRYEYELQQQVCMTHGIFRSLV